MINVPRHVFPSTSAADKIRSQFYPRTRLQKDLSLTMPIHTESNACSACARSKRKCGRQMPSCARCADKGKSCVYPPSRSRPASSFRPLLSDAFRGSVPRVEDRLLAEVAGSTSSSTANLILVDDLMLDLAVLLMGSEFAAPS